DRKRDMMGVEVEFGVPPRLMVDYQTLVGDAVDNVPGVDKVGPKTAVKLLKEYGSLDALIERAHEIKGAVGENLRKALDWLPKGSATGPTGGLFEEPDLSGLSQATTLHYETIFTWDALETWVHRLEAASLVALDTETDSLDEMLANIVGLSFSTEPGLAAYVPLAHDYQGAPDQLSRDAVLERLKPWLENPEKRKLGQHVKYDRHVFANHGIEV